MTGVSRPAWDDSNGDAWRNWWRSVPKDDLIDTPVPPKGTLLSEAGAVFLALVHSLRGIGRVSPNPLVGCVVVSKEHFFLGVGAHLERGQGHAEVNALTSCGNEELDGAIVYVTLEPCAHQGLTPPCADKLASLPISSVRYIIEDPNPLVSGRGAKRIAEAGIDVKILNQWADGAEELMEVFLTNQRQKRTFVGMKVASTDQGIYALPDSSRYWITSTRSRDYGHYLRMYYDGVLVGSNTVILDNPQLNVRNPRLKARWPWQIVVDPDGAAWGLQQIPHLLINDNERVIWFVGQGAKLKKHPNLMFKGKIIELPLDSRGKFYWSDLLQKTFELGCYSLLIEGGASIWEDAIQSQVVDKFHWFVAPDRSDLVNGVKWKQPSWFDQRKKFCFKLDQDEYFEFTHGGNA